MNKSKDNLPYIVIAGPTAAGKTKTAAALAGIISGEIISADSMQIYKGMDIGTATPALNEMEGIPHYLISEIMPDEEYSAYIFKQKAEAYAAKIRGKGLYPIICGGTGFYINALIGGNEFTETKTDTTYREELYLLAAGKGNEAVHRLLQEIDPESASAIHQNNLKKVVRALEYYKQTGSKISEHNKREKAKEPENAFVAVLSMDRNLLYERINSRVDLMVEKGLVDEVKGLLDRGIKRSLVSMQGIGYKETAAYLEGETTLDAAIEKIKTGSRHYAKRQLTWFAHQCKGIWYNVTDYKNHIALAGAIAKDINKGTDRS